LAVGGFLWPPEESGPLASRTDCFRLGRRGLPPGRSPALGPAFAWGGDQV